MKLCGKREQSLRSSKLLTIYNLFKNYILKVDSESALPLVTLMDLPMKDYSEDHLVKFCQSALDLIFASQIAKDLNSLNLG